MKFWMGECSETGVSEGRNGRMCVLRRRTEKGTPPVRVGGDGISSAGVCQILCSIRRRAPRRRRRAHPRLQLRAIDERGEIGRFRVDDEMGKKIMDLCGLR